METANKRLVLASVNQVLMLVKTNPKIVDNIPRFAPLLNAQASTAPKKSCNCGGRQNITTPDVNKQIAENILSSLSTDEFVKIKTVLGLSELCYYKRNTESNKLELVCV
jgi:hypothetical protein